MYVMAKEIKMFKVNNVPNLWNLVYWVQNTCTLWEVRFVAILRGMTELLCLVLT